jgi:hypothetical protein
MLFVGQAEVPATRNLNSNLRLLLVPEGGELRSMVVITNVLLPKHSSPKSSYIGEAVQRTFQFLHHIQRIRGPSAGTSAVRDLQIFLDLQKDTFFKDKICVCATKLDSLRGSFIRTPDNTTQEPTQHWPSLRLETAIIGQ